MEIVDKEAETKDTDYFSREGVINGTNVKHSVFAANDNLEFNIVGLDGIAFGAGSTVTVRNSINYGVFAGNLFLLTVQLREIYLQPVTRFRSIKRHL